MIAFLSGRVASKSSAGAVIEVAGVGYRLLMSTSALSALPAEGDDVTVQTHLHVREDELTLYGFESEDEREAFIQLIAVSGVGPKVALAILSVLRPESLRAAVAGDDLDLLSSVPGIGKKTAQRLVLELRDRLGAPGIGPAKGGAAVAVAEARAALLAMGFSAAEAAMALRDAPAGARTEDLLKAALKSLGGAR
jgi:Holliday junction DNA helicase RuvA